MNKQKVAIAMSGGVDSTAAALILKERGFNIFGMTMKLFEESENTVAEAKRAAAELNIEHVTLDLSAEFKKHVTDYFVNEYARGCTPNPCVECNRFLKFGAFWEEAKKRGADYMATGHYVRIQKDKQSGKFELLKGNDSAKDQSYMLYHLNQEILAHVLFPLGELSKSEVREIAGKNELTAAKSKESQDICFIPDGDYRKYYCAHSTLPIKKGKFVLTTGETLGTHQGIHAYTIGQRRGLGIAYTEPLFVVDIDAAKNEVILGTASEVFASGVIVENVSFIDGDELNEKKNAEVKIRYAHKAVSAELIPNGEKSVKVVFAQKQRAVTRGQSAVFYAGDKMLGGGIITYAIKSE